MQLGKKAQESAMPTNALIWAVVSAIVLILLIIIFRSYILPALK